MDKSCAVILSSMQGNSFNNYKAEIIFKPVIDWVSHAVLSSGIRDVCIVKDDLTALQGENIRIVSKEQQDFCVEASVSLKRFLSGNLSSNVLVLSGDTPFVNGDMIKGALSFHEKQDNDVTLVSAKGKDCSGYGRVVRSRKGEVEAVAQGDSLGEKASSEHEVYAGAFWIRKGLLTTVLDKLDNRCNKEESYLSDTLTICLKEGGKVGAFLVDDEIVPVRVYDFVSLNAANEIARGKVLNNLMKNGVEIVCSDGVMIGPDVVIGEGTKILQGTIIRGSSKIGEGCLIGPNTLVEDTIVGNNVKLNAVHCYKSRIEDEVTAGPFAHIRPNSVICKGVKIGDFVEIKNSVVGAGTHISHLTYVGDSDVGENVNFGCGCVTVNYDGQKKSRCTIGNNVFLGCNTNLIAPVTLEDNAFTAAGSTITRDVPKDALAIARSRQVNIAGWVERKRGKSGDDKEKA